MTDLSPAEATQLPRYPLLPAGLIGRQAVAKRCAGQGIGVALILDAAARAARAEPAIFALIVDAKDQNAERFYQHLGFRPLVSRPSNLFWPIAEAPRGLSERCERLSQADLMMNQLWVHHSEPSSLQKAELAERPRRSTSKAGINRSAIALR